MTRFDALFSAMSAADLAAVTLLFAAWLAVGFVIENPPAARPSVSFLMRAYRHEWMRQFITRQPRIFDSAILASLREGTTFFASATMIAIGGGLALLGNLDRLRGVAAGFEAAGTPVILWQAKIVVTLIFVANAFLKFVWAHRLFGYCAIMMASVPNEPEHPAAIPRAAQAAQINVTAARSFNAGLRSVYFAIAALGWLAGPLMLLATTALVTWVSWRREFTSHSRTVMLQDPPAAP
ncbi:MAG: DUF599 domain-containing protein [Paracoccus sp. (in: a-proteobacteria)]|nr:DUF599 domain-containing protein [Paracoccus sp. (in: a-proteobacteria)]